MDESRITESFLLDNENRDQVSYSMVVDRVRPPKERTFDKVQQRRISKWVDDTNVTRCYNCRNEFGWYLRKHHCRMCGHIFCWKCSDNWKRLPDYVDDIPTPTGYWKAFKRKDPVRICFACNQKLEQLEKMHRLCKVWDILLMHPSFDLSILYAMRETGNKLYYRLTNFYLSKFREIQYRLPNYRFNKFEKTLLWNNRHYFIGHSAWLTKLLLSLDLQDYNDRQKIGIVLKILNRKKRNCNQWFLMCQRHCTPKLKPEDAIIILNSHLKSTVLKTIALQTFDACPLNEFITYVPNLVCCMQSETIENSVIGPYLVEKCFHHKNYQLLSELYWQLKVSSETSSEHFEIYQYFLSVLKDGLGPKLAKSLQFVQLFTSLLDRLPKFYTENDVKEMLTCHKASLQDCIIPTRGPAKEDETIRIDIESIQVFSSWTRPILIPFIVKSKTKTRTIRIIYKREDVRKDKIVMNIIQLMDIHLKRYAKINMNILTYPILPITSTSGLIEFVENCDTLYTIRKKHPDSPIMSYLIDQNPNSPAQTLRTTFTKSCAAYAIITYLLGIGDRHLENIMLNKDGMLFHIDFGYILGFDPKPHVNMMRMRISNDMVTAMGGTKSDCYNKLFKKLCNVTFNCLRRRADLFVTMLSLLVESKPTIQNSVPFTQQRIYNEVVRRFIPGETYQEAKVHLDNTIDHSTKSAQYAIVDFLHYHNKEKTISGMLNGAYESTRNMISTLGGMIMDSNLF